MRHQNYELLIFLTFIGIIALGTFALSLPFVHHVNGVSFIDALFTATSAVCVTGLTTISTTGFNVCGQLILLILMQIGAIGIMTLTASCILFFRGGLDLQNRMMVARLSVAPDLSSIDGVLKTVIAFTLVTELVGLLFLAAGFLRDGHSWTASLFYGLFHAVSAFCNAGFSLFDTSLQDAGSMVQIVTLVLIILGGLGYYVIFDCMEYIKKKDHLTMHTRIVLSATLVCVVCGAVLLKITEYGQLSLVDAFFQSITARTAGFSSVMIDKLHGASLLVLIVLMIIGAAPGSTGGGIKLTTCWVIGAMVYSSIRGRDTPVFFNRCMPQNDTIRACTLAATYLAFLCFCVGLLLYFEEMGFMSTLFEVTSAVGTVGLSMGITPQLGVSGKLILIAAMLGGRIGPVVVVLMLLRSKKKSHVEYPVEKIILG